MDFLVLIYIPLFTALIGWLTNKVAIKMLFRPRRPVRVFFWTWQGLVPRRQAEIAARTGEIIERELLSQHFLREKIKQIDLRSHMHDFAIRLIRHGVGERLKSIPLIGGFINESTISKLESIAAEELAREAPALIAMLGDEAEHHLDIKSYIEEQINGFDLDKLEEVVNQVASSEFRNIELMGGVLGFIVGVAQLLLLWLTGNLSLSF